MYFINALEAQRHFIHVMIDNEYPDTHLLDGRNYTIHGPFYSLDEAEEFAVREYTPYRLFEKDLIPGCESFLAPEKEKGWHL